VGLSAACVGFFLRGLWRVTPAVTGSDDDDGEWTIDGSSDSTTLPYRSRLEWRAVTERAPWPYRRARGSRLID